MTRAAKVVCWLTLLVLPCAVAAAPPSKEEIAKAVKELGDNNFSVREKATEFLRKAGRAAEPMLQEAARSTDAEVVRRSREILEDFKWGAYPDTPKNVLDLIQRYRAAADVGNRLDVADQLAKLGAPGYGVLVKIAAAEDNQDLRQALFHRVSRGAPTVVVSLLLEENHAEVEELLEMCLASQDEASRRNYAAFLLLRKKLDQAISRVTDQAALAPDARRSLELLAVLHRANGDLPKARAAAEKAQNPALLQGILTETRDWKELARRSTADDMVELGAETIGYRAAYHRLAGNNAESDKAVAQICKLADDDPENSSTAWLAAKSLFLNDRTSEALALLRRAKNDRPVFDVLAHQMKYAEALELAGKLPADHSQKFEVDLRRAQVLLNLGEKDAALQLFARLADQADQKNELPSAWQDLIKAELRSGLREQAFAHAGRSLAKAERDNKPHDLLGQLFPQKLAAAVWFDFLFLSTEKQPDCLRGVRNLLDGKIKDRELDDLLRKAEELGQALPAAEHARWYGGLAEVCQATGRPAEAEKHLLRVAELPDGAAALIQLGDLRAEKNQWKEAALRYQQAWEKDRSQPLPLHLWGHALVQSGQEAEGKKRMELAHWLPLANEQVRYVFASGLTQHGMYDAARREREFLLRVGPVEGWHMNETLRHLAYDALGRREYARSADLFEQFRLRCLRSGVGFVENSAYVQVPALVHQVRALAALAADKFDDAKDSMRQCLGLLPGNVNLAIGFVAELDRRGRKGDGDEVFAHAFDAQEKVVAAFPQSAASHNTCAWLAACCRRDLDKALDHARKASTLAPDHAGYLDTLAEVHFQRGDQAKALAIIKKCLEMEPKNDYFQKQLKRIEAGDPKVAAPEG